MFSTSRHLVVGDIDGPQRLLIRDPLKGSALAYVIVRDEAIDLRQAAVQRLDRRLAGAPPMRLPPGFAPTPFQQRRLNMLLDILDAVPGRERTAITPQQLTPCPVNPDYR